LVQAWG
jgi:mRNA-degrading endonuclease toxin of MazEF toxin-antitoxin module